jgi:GNAT superfamily N-acetyltransferase
LLEEVVRAAMTLSLRRFQSGDADRLWTVHERALRESDIEFIEDKADEDFTTIPERYLETGGEFLVGVVDDEVVAMGGIRPITASCAEIRRMRVHPDYQGRGYGKRMLTALESRAVDLGFGELTLYTNSKLIAARELYSRQGYEVMRWETDDATGESFIHFRKVLGSSAIDTSDI